MATAQELMEQNQELSRAVTELAEQTLEEQVLAKLKEIEAILTKLDAESIDLSVFLEQIQSFSDEKKAELQALVDKIDNPLGSKTITMKTFAPNSRLLDGGGFYQEVYMKDGAITKYGDVFFGGYVNADVGGFGAGNFGFKRQPLPQDVEFDYICASALSYYARPKAGQSNVGGVVGSLDNYLFVWGYNGVGQLGTADTATKTNGAWISFSNRVEVIQSSAVADAGFQNSTYVILSDGGLYGAGRGTWGQLGQGNTINSSTFLKISDDVKNVFTDGMSCIFVKSNEVMGCGLGIMGYIGQGSTSQQNTPKRSIGVLDPSSVKCNMGYFYSTNNYAQTYLAVDGKLYGAGRNAYHQIDSSGTSDKLTFVEVKTSGNSSITIGENDTFQTNADEAWLLKENGGNFDFYHAGYSYSGAGSSATGINQSFTKMKTFEGLGWEMLMDNNRTDGSPCHNCCVFNKKTRQVFVLGSNAGGQLGNGTSSPVYTLSEITLPHSVKKAENFEIRLSRWNDHYGILIIADGEFFMAGSTSQGRKRIATNTFQKEN